MIVNLPDTTSREVARKLVELHETEGSVNSGRVLTLVVCAEHDEPTEGAIEAAIAASREHPSRVIVVSRGVRHARSRMDAEIRIGGDAGASEVIVLSLAGDMADHAHAVVIPFLLPDTPVVTWWPSIGPARPASDPLGTLGRRRIMDANRDPGLNTVLQRRLAGYSPGDTDIAWTQITPWRAILASALDRPPFTPVLEVDVTGPDRSPAIDLLAGWLRTALGVPTRRLTGSFEVRLVRTDGDTVLGVDENNNAVLTAPGKPDGKIAMTQRSLPVCIAEELRRLDVDEVYASALAGVADVERISTEQEALLRADLRAAVEHAAQQRDSAGPDGKE